MMKRGFTLVEILIVVGLFSVLSVVVAQTVIVSLRGSLRSGSSVDVRENITGAADVVVRHLRNAQNVIPCESGNSISYVDQNGDSGSFSCVIGVDSGYVASQAARLTSEGVVVDSCLFTCTETLGQPQSVSVSISGYPAKVGVSGRVDLVTGVELRSY